MVTESNEKIMEFVFQHFVGTMFERRVCIVKKEMQCLAMDVKEAGHLLYDSSMLCQQRREEKKLTENTECTA